MNTALHQRFAGMGMQVRPGRPGFGASGAQTGVAIGSTIATATVPMLVGPSVAVTLGLGGSSAVIGATAAGVALAVPIVGAAIAAITIGIELLMNSGCGQTCIVTSQWANQAAAQLEQNIKAYFAIAPPRPQSVQQLALANFQTLWNQLVQLCSQPGLSTAGQNCINDRAAGACKWKALAPEFPGQPAVGTCWNWWNAYHDPIANDPDVAPSAPLALASSGASSAVSGVTNTLSGVFGNFTPYILVGAAMLGGFLLLESVE